MSKLKIVNQYRQIWQDLFFNKLFARKELSSNVPAVFFKQAFTFLKRNISDTLIIRKINIQKILYFNAVVFVKVSSEISH